MENIEPMNTIRVDVNKQMDGYSFSISPSVRNLLKSLFPDSHPANGIFVAYDTKSDFENYWGKLESHIYPTLLGIDDLQELKKKVNKILFIDTKSGKTLTEQIL